MEDLQDACIQFEISDARGSWRGFGTLRVEVDDADRQSFRIIAPELTRTDGGPSTIIALTASQANAITLHRDPLIARYFLCV